jgi:hypothetical protein
LLACMCICWLRCLFRLFAFLFASICMCVLTAPCNAHQRHSTSARTTLKEADGRLCVVCDEAQLGIPPLISCGAQMSMGPLAQARLTPHSVYLLPLSSHQANHCSCLRTVWGVLHVWLFIVFSRVYIMYVLCLLRALSRRIHFLLEWCSKGLFPLFFPSLRFWSFGFIVVRTCTIACRILLFRNYRGPKRLADCAILLY